MRAAARRGAALLAAMLSCSVAGPARAAPSNAPYAARGTCAGYPRVALKTPPGHCVALLADATAGLRFPRRLLEVAPGRFWLADMGSGESGRGRLLEFTLPAPGAVAAPIVFTTLADRLDRPLGLVLGPDGRVWIGEAGRIVRTPVGAPGTPVRLQTVVDGLPDSGSHPLKEIVFGAGGRLYVNVGSSSDACRDDAGRQAVPCPDLEGARPRAAVYEIVFAGPDMTQPSLRPFATGLRNSVALAFVAGPGRLLQGENSIDYPEATSPPEELNALRDGGRYGWPYCTGARTPARGYEGRFDCAATEAPVLLWPAHAAPLHMLAFAANARHAFAGQLLVAWHGYRVGGHRVASFAIGPDGLPRGPAKEWIGGWNAEAGVRPLGAPTGLAVDGAGRLLVVEDRHKTLLMLVREGR